MVEANRVEVGTHNGEVDIVERLDRLELDHHPRIDHEVEPV